MGATHMHDFQTKELVLEAELSRLAALGVGELMEAYGHDPAKIVEHLQQLANPYDVAVYRTFVKLETSWGDQPKPKEITIPNAVFEYLKVIEEARYWEAATAFAAV
jgi:hypothetical protein